jgi:hypothetical protein
MALFGKMTRRGGGKKGSSLREIFAPDADGNGFCIGNYLELSIN